MNNETSELRMISYGLVAANKPLKSMDIEVTPMEKLTMLNGEITDNITTVNVKGKDADNASFETTASTAVSVSATWLPMSSNRKTAPDVRRGEKVCIWQYSDSDKYYWSALEYNSTLRKKETITYMLSNTEDEAAEATEENTYFINLSTHSKVIHIHTGTSDGEPYGYDILLNTKEGTFQITDTSENTIFLDSANNRIVLKNAKGTAVDLNAVDLFINVVRNAVMQVGGDFTTIVKGKYSLKAEGGYLTDTSEAIFVTPILSTSEQFTTGSDAKIGATLETVDSAIFGSSVNIKGSLGLKGGMKTGTGGGDSSGDIELNGSITSSGSASFVGTVTAANIT